MKKPNLKTAQTSALIFALALSALTATSARASLRTDFQLVDQAGTRVMRAAQKVVAKTKFKFDAGVCFGIASVRKGDFIQSAYPLKKGVTYVFFSAGDNNAQNVDLELRANGKVVAKDVASDAIPAIQYTAKANGAHSIMVRLKKSKTATSFCALIVMRTGGGYGLPLADLAKLARSSGQMPKELDAVSHLIRFHRTRNEWTIYGAVLKKGDVAALSDMNLGSGNRAILAMGDDRVKDLDLFLFNKNEKLLASSTDQGAKPSLIHKTQAGQKYTIAIANRQSTGTALSLILVMEVTAQVPATKPPRISTSDDDVASDEMSDDEEDGGDDEDDD